MSTSGDSSSLSSSLTDLMTSLAVIFVLLLVASLNNIGQKEKRVVTSLHVILEKVLEDFKKVGVEVKADEKDPLVLLVIVPEDLFRFGFDRADIPPQGIEFLQKFTPKLVAQICKERDKIASIIVEGHADDRGPVRANIDRSQQRSSAVVIESLHILEESESLDLDTRATLSKCFRDLVAASGRGNAEPMFDTKGRPDRDRSRRVVFKIRVRSLELTKLLGSTPSTSTPVQ